ncbi:conjugal transfer protein TrbE [Variovorax sp. UMC13]|uniref:conjugal transfer protein TrbE n=1 Tax=Variovorax sp. UMC13 TaxID=1862326 RepID=UPI0015FFD7D2|nr:conjugal transfer protein TrbE [Variovorax sp. UMC13]MBB1600763.1 conjugal transfer protein TrbE [Variovorax sp. UMC13]
MMHLAEYRARPSLLADWLPWAALVAPGVVLNKDGSFQRTARFRGPDLDSATPSELAATTARLNNALRRLGSGWALFVEAERRPSANYPVSSFPEPLAWLVDEERRAAFEEEARHFESIYHLTVMFLPGEQARARAAGLLYEQAAGQATDWRERLEAFVAETGRFFGLFEGVMPEAAWLDDAQTLTYLHGCVSAHRQRVAVPEVPMHLDAWLADAALAAGLSPMLGDRHLRVLTVRGFPSSTWPGLLDDLNRLGLAYRWCNRFLCLDKSQAERELARLRRQWFAKRKSIVALLRETVFQQESPLVDSDAANKALDADAALQDLGSDQVAFGYITATVVVLDAEAYGADEKLRAIERAIQSRGFVTIAETLNAVDAWLSSLPGHAYANVRQPLISTLNLAHMLPVSAVWAGPERNAHLDGPPLIVTRTDGATPFRLVTHVGDVGHTLVVGPTGMGKSVLLATLAMQFRRYPASRIFAFDMGRSMRATVLGLGGEHYDLGADRAIAFQPLASIDREDQRAWAAGWVEDRLSHEGVVVGPPERAAVWSALASLASAPREERTITGLSLLLQSNALRQALQPYMLGGPHGLLLDAESDRLGDAGVQCFEMEELMHSKAAALAVLGYLFSRLDARFDGAPALLILDEAWLFLDAPVFAARLRQWLKTLRKKNVSVVFATQSLADIRDSSIAPAIVESCASRIFLPNAQASEPQIRHIYEGFGLNSRQIDLVTQAQPRRDYYYQSHVGNRVFDLGLGPVALAFAGASSPQDQRAIDAVEASLSTSGGATSSHGVAVSPGAAFAAAWLRHRGLDWAADLLSSSTRGTLPGAAVAPFSGMPQEKL